MGSDVVILPAGGDKDTKNREIRIALEMAGIFKAINMKQEKIETRPWDAAE